MDNATLFVAAVTLLVIFLIQRFTSRHKYAPGPISLPFLGYIPFLGNKPYLDFQKLAEKYGNVFSIRLGSAYVIVLNDFQSTKEAFAQDALMGRPPETTSNLNKETLETGAFSGLPWKEQRRFSLHQLRDLGLGKSKMEGHIQEEIADLCSELDKHIDRPFCIYDILAPSVSNNISALVYGKRLKYNDPVRQMMTRALKTTASASGQAAWMVFLPSITKVCRFLGIGNVSKVNKIFQEMKDYTWKEINEHENTLDPSNVRDFIDGYLLEIKNRKDPAFSKRALQDLVGGFFGAGSETVRLSVEWLLLTAAANQDAQRRIQQEIDETVGKNQPVAWLDHKSMPFTQAFIMELMRWRTLIPINLLRYALADSEVSGYRIPKGSILLSNLWAIHHDPEYWGADAEEFRPERFLTDDGQDVKKWDHFIPFSIGKRQCPGEPMAKVEVFMYFTSILQNYNVKLPVGKVANFEGDLGIGLVPKPQELIFSKRN